MTEGEIIKEVFMYMKDVKRSFATADIIYSCAAWAKPGSAEEVKRWLKYGIEHHGNYSGIFFLKFGIKLYVKSNASVEALKLAFNRLNKLLKENGISKPKRIQKIN